MPVNFSIKQVPENVAERVRQRARANRRSLQSELLLIIEHAAAGDPPVTDRVGEPPAPAYASPQRHRKGAGKAVRKPDAPPRSAGKLSLDQLWQRARKLGAATPDESTAIIRRDRDVRHGR